MDHDMVQDVEAGDSGVVHYDIYAPAQDEQMMTYGASPASTEMLTEAVALKASSESGDDANEIVMVEEYDDDASDAGVEAHYPIETALTNDETYTGTADPDVLAAPGEDVIDGVEEKSAQVTQPTTDQEHTLVHPLDGEAHGVESDKGDAEVVIATPAADAATAVEAPAGVSLTHTRAAGVEDPVADHIAGEEAGRGRVEASGAESALPQPSVDSSVVDPVRVAFNGQDFIAFGSAEKSTYTERDRPSQEVSAPTLNIDLHVANETLDMFFEALRFKDSLGDFLDEGTELSVSFVDLNLTLREDDIYSREVTVEDIRRIHAGLGYRHTPHLIITENQRFITRYNELASQASLAIEQNMAGEEAANADPRKGAKESLNEEDVQIGQAIGDGAGIEDDHKISQAEDERTKEMDREEGDADGSAGEDAEGMFVTVDNARESSTASASEEEYTPSLDESPAHLAGIGISDEAEDVATAHNEDGDYVLHAEPFLSAIVDNDANGSAVEAADYVGETDYVEDEEEVEEVAQDDVENGDPVDGTVDQSKPQVSSKRAFDQDGASVDDDDDDEAGYTTNDADSGRSDSKRLRYDQAETK